MALPLLLRSSDSLVLRWPGSPADHAPRDIPKNVNQFFNVVSVRKNSPCWRFHWQERFSSLAGLSNYSGTYRFTVLVTGDGVKPGGRMIDVSYDGKDWNTLRTWDRGRFRPLSQWDILSRWRNRRRNK